MATFIGRGGTEVEEGTKEMRSLLYETTSILLSSSRWTPLQNHSREQPPEEYVVAANGLGLLTARSPGVQEAPDVLLVVVIAQW